MKQHRSDSSSNVLTRNHRAKKEKSCWINELCVIIYSGKNGARKHRMLLTPMDMGQDAVEYIIWKWIRWTGLSWQSANVCKGGCSSWDLCFSLHLLTWDRTIRTSSSLVRCRKPAGLLTPVLLLSNSVSYSSIHTADCSLRSCPHMRNGYPIMYSNYLNIFHITLNGISQTNNCTTV